MPRQYLYSYLVALFLINALWAFIPIGYGAIGQKAQKQDWMLTMEGERKSTDLQDLMRDGFWGQSDIDFNGMGTAIKDVEQAEAKKLRANVKAIIHRNQQVQVLFSDGKKVHRIAKGETLKGSDWVLIDAGNDWLILQKQQAEGIQERLKLFSRVEAKKGAK